MKTTNYIVISVIIACSPCISSQTVEIQSKSTYCQWGFRWSHMDSTGNHAQGVSTKQNCFPGLEQFASDYKKMAIEIFDKRGELQYNSTVISENWICKDDQNMTCPEGTYFYRLITETTKKPSQKDTITGQLVLYRKQ